MIQANELRLNNWVYSIEIGDNVQISAISEDGFSFKNCVTWDYPNIEEIYPIPLTEEILLKCGCEINPLSVGISYKYLYRLVWDDEFEYWDILQGEYGNFITRIKFVHEWQNLIFALTAEELNIEL